MRHSRLILIILTAFLIAACQKPNPASSSLSPAQLFYYRVRYSVTPKTPEDRCLISQGEHRDDLPAAVADEILTLTIDPATSIDWTPIFESAAGEAGVRKAQVSTVALEGEPGVFLVAVDWCYGLSGYDLYVVEPGVDAWLISENPGEAGTPEVRWLDEAWVVMTDFTAGIQALRMELVGQQDGEWILLMHSEQLSQEGDEFVYWHGVNKPRYIFENAYRLMIVEVESPDGKYTRTTYKWEDGWYVKIAEENLEEK